MRKLLILLLGLTLIGILSYFCFLDKASGITNHLVAGAENTFAQKQMGWVDTKIKGDGLDTTRILTLNGLAPTKELKDEAEKIALAQEGVSGVENLLVVKEAALKMDAPEILVPKVEEPKHESVSKINEPEVLSPKVEEPKIEEPKVVIPSPVLKTPNPTPEVVVEKPVFSCQSAFKKILSENKIHFAFNKAAVKASSYGLLDSLVEVANKCPKDAIAIEGHTDSDGRASYNKRLSLQRAKAVKSYLVSKGIDAHRLKAIGYGETKPIVGNKTARGKAKNRRIEFIIIDIKDVPKVKQKVMLENTSQLIEITSIDEMMNDSTYSDKKGEK